MKKIKNKLKYEMNRERCHKRSCNSKKRKLKNHRRRHNKYFLLEKTHKHNQSFSPKKNGSKVKKMNKTKKTIYAPEYFSIIDNYDITIEFFKDISEAVKNDRGIFLNFSNVTKLSPDSLLYLLAVIENLKNINCTLKLEGNYPIDEKCKEIFLASGFIDHLIKGLNLKLYQYADNNVFSIRSSDSVNAEIANQVIKFANSLKPLEKFKQQRIQNLIMEAISNSYEHAYNETSKYKKWWLIAYHDVEKNLIRFSIVDNGFGIPRTIRKRYHEYIFKKSDCQLIASACNGEFRTKTREMNRGKGLPSIKEHADNKIVEDLIIISQKGFINLSSNESILQRNKFYGTLISWSF